MKQLFNKLESTNLNNIFLTSTIKEIETVINNKFSYYTNKINTYTQLKAYLSSFNEKMDIDIEYQLSLKITLLNKVKFNDKEYISFTTNQLVKKQ
jgi:hypothetical protein